MCTPEQLSQHLGVAARCQWFMTIPSWFHGTSWDPLFPSDSLMEVWRSDEENWGTAVLLHGRHSAKIHFPKLYCLWTYPLLELLRQTETFIFFVFSYQLLHNVSSKIFLIMSRWLYYNSSISLQGKLNFSANWEDLFIFFWMTRYWVNTYKMKKIKYS